MLDIIKAHYKMKEAIRDNLSYYFNDDSVALPSKWEVFTLEETSEILPEWDLGLPSELLGKYFKDPLTLKDLGLVSGEVYTYETVLECIMAYVYTSFDDIVLVGYIDTLDDLEYELQELILRNGYYYVEV
jgi:hypothetical protein